MDNITNRAILIGVSLFVSIAVISALVIVINQTREIYRVSSENSFLFTKGFSEFDMYSNTTIKGVDVLNCIKRYEQDDRIVIIIKETSTTITIRCGQKVNILPQINNYRAILEKEYSGESGYNMTYKASYDDTGNTEKNKVIITFVKL